MRLTTILVSIFYLFTVNVTAGVAPPDIRQKASDKVWEEQLRKPYFQDREIVEEGIIEVKAPHAAEDATLVPISVHLKKPQTKEQYIQKISIFVDKNPVPLVGVFEFTQASGKADLAMRIRVDDFSYVRAIAEDNQGTLHMSKRFVRAKGACSVPPPAGAAESKRLLGKMRIKTVGNIEFGEPNLVQLKIKHPNITGMAPVEIGSRVRPPAFFLKDIMVDFSGELVMKAQLTFSVSMDPAFRFFFTPDKEGELTVRGGDTKNNQFESIYRVAEAGVMPPS